MPANEKEPPRLQFNNAAGRLLLILERMKTLNANFSSHIVWRKLLFPEDTDLPTNTPLDDDSWSKIVTALNFLYGDVLEVEAAIREREPDDHEIYLREFSILKKIFTPDNLGADSAHMNSLISGELLTNLRHCARALTKEVELDETELKDVYDAASEIFELIQTTDMPLKLRRTLLSLIDRVRQAISHFQIHGSRGLDDALKQLVGGIWVHQKEIADIPNRSVIVQGLEKVWTKLALVARKASHINAIADLTQKATPLLEWIGKNITS